MHDIVVLSDLHLGRGRNPDSGRYHNLETFFYDDDLRAFCQYLCADATARSEALLLVFNGDTFDLLRVEPDAPAPDATLRERMYGPKMSPRVAAAVLAKILEGHEAFIDGLALVLAAGHRIVMLPGNHDIELQWAPVHEEVRKAVLARVPEHGGDVEAARERLRFDAWFHYEPGRIWVEHGCQYDPENAFRFWLRSELTDLPDAEDHAERDLPLGNFFQRYLYNGFGPITFIVPSTRANFRYARWLLLNDPQLLARAVTNHAPFAIQWLRRIASKPLQDQQQLREFHERELARLAEVSGLGEQLRKVDSRKDVHGDVVTAVRALAVQTVRGLLIGMTGMVSLAALWFAGFGAINGLASGGPVKALLFLTLNFLLLGVLATACGVLLFREPSQTPSPLQRAAVDLTTLLQVPIVTFGHTHDEAVARVGALEPHEGVRAGAGWYFNTGTWIAVFTHDVLLPRERVQYTYLRVRGTKGELLAWSPARSAPVPVVLLDG